VQDVLKRTRDEREEGVENKNTQNTQINLNKQKLVEPTVYLKPAEQSLYSATVPIKKNACVCEVCMCVCVCERECVCVHKFSSAYQLSNIQIFCTG